MEMKGCRGEVVVRVGRGLTGSRDIPSRSR